MLDVPTREQMLYAQLAIVDSLVEYIIDNLDHSVFEDEELYDYMDEVAEKVTCTQIRMRALLTKDRKNERA